MNKFWGHLKTITHHRHLVMRGCFRMGLIWQGLTHDLSKYSPTEFFAGVIFRAAAAPTRLNARPTAILWPGCTTRGATGIILNTGRT